MLWADPGHLCEPLLQSLSSTSKSIVYRTLAEPQAVRDALPPLSIDIDAPNNIGLFKRKRGQEHVDAVTYQFVEFSVTCRIRTRLMFHMLIP